MLHSALRLTRLDIRAPRLNLPRGRIEVDKAVIDTAADCVADLAPLPPMSGQPFGGVAGPLVTVWLVPPVAGGVRPQDHKGVKEVRNLVEICH